MFLLWQNKDNQAIESHTTIELSHLNHYNPWRFFLLAVRPKIMSINELLSECKHTAKFQKMIQKTMKWLSSKPNGGTSQALHHSSCLHSGSSCCCRRLSPVSSVSPVGGGGGSRWHKEGGEWGQEGVLCVCVFWGEGSLQTGGAWLDTRRHQAPSGCGQAPTHPGASMLACQNISLQT